VPAWLAPGGWLARLAPGVCLNYKHCVRAAVSSSISDLSSFTISDLTQSKQPPPQPGTYTLPKPRVTPCKKSVSEFTLQSRWLSVSAINCPSHYASAPISKQQSHFSTTATAHIRSKDDARYAWSWRCF
jgi:hypothetical protein